MRSTLAFLVALLLCLAIPATASAGDPLRPQQWGLDMIKADAAHSTSTGSGAVVAVIDTGVLAPHEGLAGRPRPGAGLARGPGGPARPGPGLRPGPKRRHAAGRERPRHACDRDRGGGREQREG